jgi:hypothetical protein
MNQNMVQLYTTTPPESWSSTYSQQVNDDYSFMGDIHSPLTMQRSSPVFSLVG